MPDLPTGTVTFLFTDIEGSTRLLQQVGNPRYAAVQAEHQRLLRAACVAHGGREVDTQGDAFFVAFPTATDAVATAAEAQRAFAAQPWPDGTPVQVRMGLHTGSPLVTPGGGGYVGLDVVRAARIAAAGHGGQVLLSEATRTLAEHDLPAGATLRDLGAHRLKDLQRPERLYQLVLPGLPADFPPLKTLDTRPHNLPIQPTPLIGREREVAAVCALLRRDAVRLVTLTGPGGVGKTRLGLQVAAELVEEFADGAWFVGLSRLVDPALVLPTIAQTLGLREAGSRPIREVLRDAVRTRHLLLLLDNFEHVVGAAAGVAELLATSPGLKVLVTSRVVLHLRGEKEVPVPPLGLPATAVPRLPEVEPLGQYPAVTLFLERARDARPDFQVTSATAPAVAGICAQLDGLPLAIELAAVRVKLLAPPALLQRLERRLPLLTGGARDLEARQQTMRNTLAWSYDLLSPEEQRLFRRLGVFVDGWTLAAAEAVCAAPEGAEPLGLDVLDGLGALVDQSLVQQREETDGAARFVMLHVIGEYALERLEASGVAEALRQAHAAFFMALAEQAESEGQGPHAHPWLERLEREHDNLRAALRWARDRGEVETGLRLAGALRDFWWVHGHLSEGRRWLESLLALAPPHAATSRALAGSGGRGRVAGVPDALRATALYGAANLATWQGDYARAVTLAEQSLALARQAGVDAVAAYALNRLGLLMFLQAEPERAVAQLEESLALAHRVGDPALFGGPLVNLGYVAFYLGDLAQAAARFEESLALARQAGDQFGETLTLMSLGNLARRQGDVARATTLLRGALRLARQLKDPRVVAETLEYLAMTASAADEMERVAWMLGAAAALRESHGIPQPPPERADTEAAVARTRAVLGEERWAAAVAAGRALSLEEAIGEALDAPPE